MDFYAEAWAGFRAIPPWPSDRIGPDAGFGREHFDMVITHFDLVRLERPVPVDARNRHLQALNSGGGGGRITFDHAMRVEVLPLDAGPTPAASPAVEPEQRDPATTQPRNRRR